MIWIEHLLGVMAILACIGVVFSGFGIAACMLSSQISQQEEKDKG